MRKIKDIDWFTGLGNYVFGFVMGIGFVFLIGMAPDKCDKALDDIDALGTRVDVVFDDYIALLDSHKDLLAEYERMKNSINE